MCAVLYKSVLKKNQNLNFFFDWTQTILLNVYMVMNFNTGKLLKQTLQDYDLDSFYSLRVDLDVI